eukprot:SAG11_NODE_19700_length_461_cov_0.491713_2_plen_28_part_01
MLGASGCGAEAAAQREWIGCARNAILAW